MTSKKTYIFGMNPILEWLESGLPVKQILIARESGGKPLQDILTLAQKRSIKVERVQTILLDKLADTTKHQSIIAEVELPPYSDLDAVFSRAQERNEAPLIAVLDGVQDPHNLGAILRTADAAGVHGVIIPKDQAVGLTPAVVKSSAGAAAWMPLVQETNLVRVLKELKERSFWITGADQNGDRDYTAGDFRGPTALVLGSEGKGMRRLVRESCDFLVRIPMEGKVSSLNVSVAAGLLFYEAQRQRRR